MKRKRNENPNQKSKRSKIDDDDFLNYQKYLDKPNPYDFEKIYTFIEDNLKSFLINYIKEYDIKRGGVPIQLVVEPYFPRTVYGYTISLEIRKNLIEFDGSSVKIVKKKFFNSLLEHFSQKVLNILNLNASLNVKFGEIKTVFEYGNYKTTVEFYFKLDELFEYIPDLETLIKIKPSIKCYFVDRETILFMNSSEENKQQKSYYVENGKSYTTLIIVSDKHLKLAIHLLFCYDKTDLGVVIKFNYDRPPIKPKESVYLHDIHSYETIILDEVVPSWLKLVYPGEIFKLVSTKLDERNFRLEFFKYIAFRYSYPQYRLKLEDCGKFEKIKKPTMDIKKIIL